MAPNITLRDYTADDREQIFSLMEEIYDADVMSNSRGHWAWQYHDNPRNADGPPAIRVVDRDGEIVAMICGIRQDFWLQGHEVSGLWVVDFMARQAGTNERERHRFGKRLAIELRETQPLVAGVNRPALNRYWKRILGEQIDICALPMMIRPLRGDRLAQSKVGAKVRGRAGGRVLETAAGVVGKVAAPLVFRSRDRADDATLSVREITAFGPEFDTFFRRVAPGFEHLSVRDSAFLSWRYRDIPCRRYRSFAAVRGDDLAGWIVTRTFESEGLKKGRIVDMLAAADDADAWYRLIRAVVEHHDADGADLVHGLGANHPAIESAYRDCGFRPNPEHARAAQYIAFTTAPAVDEGAFYDGDRWFVTLGDSDTDFATVV